LLLFAQHTALAHAVWHALHGGPTEHAHSNQAPKSGPGALCALDAAIGEILGGAAPAATCVFHAHAADCAPVVVGLRVVFAARFLAPLSRGPPALS
jgi:hypothetical protein